MADSEFTVFIPVLANRVGQLGYLSMRAGNYKRFPPFSSELAMQIGHDLASVEDRYLTNGPELFQLCEPFLR